MRNYTPRRALLYVPGDSDKKLSKAMKMDVDCITMDCEDGVAIGHKVYLFYQAVVSGFTDYLLI